MSDSVTDTDTKSNVDQNNKINIGTVVHDRIQVVEETIPSVGQSGIAQLGIAQSGIAQSGLEQSGIAQSGLEQSGIAQSGVVIPQTKAPFNIKTQVTRDIEVAREKGKQKLKLASERAIGNIDPKKTFVRKIIDNNQYGSQTLTKRTSGYKDPSRKRVNLSNGGKKRTKKTKKIRKNKRKTRKARKTKKSKKNETRRR